VKPECGQQQEARTEVKKEGTKTSTKNKNMHCGFICEQTEFFFLSHSVLESGTG
jgi:hypothetical protein